MTRPFFSDALRRDSTCCSTVNESKGVSSLKVPEAKSGDSSSSQYGPATPAIHPRFEAKLDGSARKRKRKTLPLFPSPSVVRPKSSRFRLTAEGRRGTFQKGIFSHR